VIPRGREREFAETELEAIRVRITTHLDALQRAITSTELTRWLTSEWKRLQSQQGSTLANADPCDVDPVDEELKPLIWLEGPAEDPAKRPLPFQDRPDPYQDNSNKVEILGVPMGGQN